MHNTLAFDTFRCIKIKLQRKSFVYFFYVKHPMDTEIFLVRGLWPSKQMLGDTFAAIFQIGSRWRWGNGETHNPSSSEYMLWWTGMTLWSHCRMKYYKTKSLKMHAIIAIFGCIYHEFLMNHYSSFGLFCVYMWIHAYVLFQWHHIDGSVQERHNSSALAMELHLSCTDSLIWASVYFKWLTTWLLVRTMCSG